MYLHCFGESINFIIRIFLLYIYIDMNLGFEWFGMNVLADEAIAKMENQLNFENFIEGAMHIGIIRDKTTNSPIPNNLDSKNVYLKLYDGLVGARIIESKFAITTIQTGMYRNTINSEYLEMGRLKTQCLTNQLIRDLSNKYTIDYSRLLDFLKKYSYKSVDQVKVLLPASAAAANKPPLPIRNAIKHKKQSPQGSKRYKGGKYRRTRNRRSSKRSYR